MFFGILFFAVFLFCVKFGLMKTICAVSGKEFEITEEDLKFYEKMGVPVPTLCPEERERRRLSWRNEQTLYRRKCSATGKLIISIHHENRPFPVYANKYWWSDKWDPLSYGRDFDFERPFFEQFVELFHDVPQIAIVNDNEVQSENCAYCQDFAYGKNCYLVMGSWKIRDSAYNRNCNEVVEVFDSDAVNVESELVYECCNAQKIYNCAYLWNSSNCSNCFFGRDLKGCTNCFGCVNLRQKEYYIFNEPHSKEEYEKKMSVFSLKSFQQVENMKRYFQKFSHQHPLPAMHMQNCEDSLGEGLFNCKNYHGYDSFGGEHCKFFDRGGGGPKYCYDIVQSGKPEWCLECITPDESWMTTFSTWCWKSKNISYSDNCHSCHDLFGCIGLKREQYCILNKQYSKEEYFKLRDKIIAHMKKTGEWGEFFPISFSPFGYNETAAYEYFPLTKEEAIKKGYPWKDEESTTKYEGPVVELPDSIDEVGDDVCEQVLTCSHDGKHYKIQGLEFEFYKKMGIPIPRKCPQCRYQERLRSRPPHRLFDRKCGSCGVDVKTAFESEKVFCESCYFKELN